jgi:hypothetical protein
MPSKEANTGAGVVVTLAPVDVTLERECRGDEVTLMIGHDDETWDIAVTFPVATVQAIVDGLDRV